MRVFLQGSIACLLIFCSPWLQAQHSKQFGDYDIFYTVLNSTFIKPEIAQRYGITRGKDKALINVAVRKQQPQGESIAQAARVTGSSYDLIHTVPLEFTEYREGDAIYYIAELSFRDKELRSFTLEILPEGLQRSPYVVKFNQKLYFEE